MIDVLVLGGGAWGTALALQADRAGNRVALWLRDPRRAADLTTRRINPRLPTIALPAAITVTSQADVSAGLRLLVVPVQQIRAVSGMLSPGAPIVVCAKGMEVETATLPLDIVSEVLPGTSAAVLSGPNFAHEIAAGMPAASVVASSDAVLRDRVADTLGTPSFRIYGNDDPVGVQVGGAAKNVIAIGAGAVVGAGLGENARAALVTRGLSEIARLSAALGGRQDTVAGLSGLGDLLLTCTGTSSRNFSLGLALGRGEPLDAALRQAMGVAEGVSTAQALRQSAERERLELPICTSVAALVEGQATLRHAIEALLGRPRKDER